MDINEIKKIILPILYKYQVKHSSLFGSVVKGKQKEESDIDILVELPEKASLLDLAGLELDLEDVLGKEVDVVTYNSLHPLLRDIILKEQVIIL